MLKDLEKRDAFLNEKSDEVLDGLYSAYDVELKDKKQSYSFLVFTFVFLMLAFFIVINYSLILEKVELLVSAQYKKNENEISIVEYKKNDSIKKREEIKQTQILAVKEPDTVVDDEQVIETEKRVIQTVGALKLDEDIALTNVQAAEIKLNKIESIQFEIDSTGINLIMKMPEEIDYLVYGLTNPERTVIEVKNAELGFKLEELEPVEPIVAIRYSINDENRFKLVLESTSPLVIRKSITSQSEGINDLIVMMDYQWDNQNSIEKEESELVAIVDQQVEIEKDVVFKGDLVKIPVSNSSDAYAEKLFQQAYISYKKGDTSESLKKLNVVLNHQPGHTKARSTLALALSEKEHYELAYSVLNEGLIQYPENTEWITVYARLLLNQGKVIEADKVLQKQTPEIAYNTEYYALHAAVLQKLNQHNEAARIYRDLLHINPLKAVWWMGLGISLESLRRYDDALYAYQKASNNRSIANDSRQFIIQRINRISSLLEDESS